MKKRAVIFCMTAIMMAVANAIAEPVFPDYGPKYLAPTEEVVTPHIKWAKPDAQGSLRVLFIVWRAGMREVIELAQRMDIKYTVFAAGGSTTHSYGNNPSEFSSNYRYDPAIARDKQALADDLDTKLDGTYDVIVLGNIDWSSFPINLRYKLLKKAHDGTPLLGVVSNPDKYLQRATAKKEKLDLAALVPFKGLPAFNGYKDAPAWIDATVDYAVFGKGKILLLKGYEVPALQAVMPGPAGNLLEPKLAEYDYYLAWIGHLLRFAAGRSAVKISGSDYMTTDRRTLTNIEFFVSGPDGKEAACVFAFRNDGGLLIGSHEQKIKLASGGTEVRFDVPRSPAGKYFADIWIKDGGKTLAYGSSFVKLTGDPAIAAIDIKNDYRCNDKVTGKIKVSAAKEAGKALALVLRQRDTYGRVTARARYEVPDIPANAAREINFELSGSQPITIVQYLEADLCKGDEVLCRVEKFFSISDLPPRNDIRVIGWGDGFNSYPEYYMFDELARAGFDTQLSFSEIAFLSNIRYLPYAVRIIDRKTDYYPKKIPHRTMDDHVREPCLTDPAYRKQLAEILSKAAGKCRPYSTSELSMGDECHFECGNYELCFCKYCVAAFHKFLAEEYGSVENMNMEYGAHYKTFDEVQPLTLKEAKKNANLQPLWVDFRRHMENTWAGAYSYGGDVVRKILPSARVGYEGSDTLISSYRAADHYKLMKNMQLNGTYDGAFVPYAVLCFAQPGTLLGLGWYGGYNGTRCPEYQRYMAWRRLFRGANSYWVFTAHAAAQGSQSIMAPDMSLYDFAKANMTELREIKSGIGKLLMTSQRADDGVAILYSASSIHAATLTEGLPQMQDVLNALTPLFEDSGRQFRIVSYEQVADGELKNGKYRLLWMPYVQALSRKEAKEIETFVGEGGVVIADLRPGVRDEHGKPYEGGGILDKVFGVRQMTDKAAPTNCAVKIEMEGCPNALHKADCDQSVKLVTGEAHASLAAEKPALIMSRYGKGSAILLNFSLANYAGVKGDLESSAVNKGDDSGGILELFKILMAQAGIEEPAKVEPEVDGVRMYRFVRDGITYLGVLQELPEPSKAYVLGVAKPLVTKPVELKLSGKKHIYDSRKGKYLGYTDRIKVEIEPARAMLFALMPYEIKGVKLNAPKRIGQGEKFEYEAAIEGVEHPGLHVFHVELVPPKEDPLSCYSENITGENGMAKGSVLFALNDLPGEWRVRVKDAATGITAERTFTVEERKEK